MVKAWKSFATVMVWPLVLSVVMGAVLYGSVEQANAADFHVTTAAELQAALNAAENNGQDDVIYLAAGTYQGNFEYEPPDTEYKSLSIRGEPGTSVEDIVLDGQDSGEVLHMSDNAVEGDDGPVAEIRVNGMTFQNGNSLLAGGGIYALTSRYDIFITDCVIKDNTAQAYGGGLYMDSNRDLYLENNLMLNNTVTEPDSGPYSGNSDGGGAFVFVRAGVATISNNVIAGNEASGATDPRGGGLIVKAYSSVPTVVHLMGNTIYANQANKGGGAFLMNINTLDIYNNIIYANTAIDGGDIYFEGVANRIGYNNDYSDMWGLWTESGSNLDTDPAFVGPASGDYHLNDSSPCIDAGTAAVPNPPGLPATDIEGNPRVSYAAPDIGAYEACDPWAYDENQDGIIQKMEAILAIMDYFDGKISKAQVIQVIMLYFA